MALSCPAVLVLGADQSVEAEDFPDGHDAENRGCGSADGAWLVVAVVQHDTPGREIDVECDGGAPPERDDRSMGQTPEQARTSYWLIVTATSRYAVS